MPAKIEKQRKFFGLVRAIQKGQAAGSSKVQKSAHSISAEDASDFARKSKRQKISKTLMNAKSGY
mgnify:CR=1 FL=1